MPKAPPPRHTARSPRRRLPLPVGVLLAGAAVAAVVAVGTVVVAEVLAQSRGPSSAVVTSSGSRPPATPWSPTVTPASGAPASGAPASGANTPATRRADGRFCATRDPLASAPRWERVLTRMLCRRAQAYAAGDPAALATVHAAGSAALAADRAALRAYLRRGLTVDGAVVRVHAVRVVARRPAGVALRVVDRLAAATAVGPSGARRELPRDRLSAHRIQLVRTPAGWRIERVTALTG